MEKRLILSQTHTPEMDILDRSKFLKLHQIDDLRAGVVVALKQSAKHLRRNLLHTSPEKRISMELARRAERR
jgi:hypothetical protein